MLQHVVFPVDKTQKENQRQIQKQIYTLLQIEAAAITTTIAEAEERPAAFVVAVAVVDVVVGVVAVVVAVVLDSFISIVKFAINCSSAAQRQPSANYVHASNRYRYRSVTDTRGQGSGRCRQNYIQIQIQAVLWIQIQRIRNYKFTVYKYSVQHRE